jgi:hypothetical protein
MIVFEHPTDSTEFVERSDRMLLTLNKDRMLVLENTLIHDMKLTMLDVHNTHPNDNTESTESTEYRDSFE